MKNLVFAVLMLSSTLDPIYSYSGQMQFEELIKKGDTFYKSGNYDEAIKYFSEAIDSDPLNAKGYWYRGDAWFYKKKYGEAAKDYTRAIEIEPQNSLFYRKRGSAFYNSNEFSHAEKDYSKAIELNPADPLLWRYRGDCFRQMRIMDKACEDYKKSDGLGSRDARKTAVFYKCSWAMSEKNSAERANSRVKVDPFTGAVIVSNLLSFENFEVKPEKGGGFVTGNEIGINEKITARITNPKNFVADTKGDLFIGAGYALFDGNGKEIARVDDIYKNSVEGVPSRYLSHLSMSLAFSPPLVPGNNYIIKMWFFDKRGEGRIDINFRFILTTRTLSSSMVSTTRSVFGKGIVTAAVRAEVKTMRFLEDGGAETISPENLKTSSIYSINLIDSKNLKGVLKCSLMAVDEKGGSVSMQYPEALFDGNGAKIKFSTEGIPPGRYHLWISVRDNSGSSIGIVVPVALK